MRIVRSRRDVICVVPARAGSRRLPRKNLALLGGKPLLAWIIGAALDSNVFEHVYVSTEDPEIAMTAKYFGAEVPYSRPQELARDDVSALQVAIDLVCFLRSRGEDYETICVSAPTAPLVISDDFSQAYRLFQKSKAKVLHSICELEEPPQWALKLEDRSLRPMFGLDAFKQESQQLSKSYRILGGIQLFQTSYLLKEKSYIGDPMVGYLIRRERGVDVNTLEDLELAEFYLRRRRSRLGVCAVEDLRDE